MKQSAGRPAFGYFGAGVVHGRRREYDPISQKDYYALGGVFANSGFWEHNLAPETEVAAYQAQRRKVKAAEDALAVYVIQCALELPGSDSAQSRQNRVRPLASRSPSIHFTSPVVRVARRFFAAALVQADGARYV